jgi:DNA-binding CsgD family transcriptional regulator
MRARLLYRLAHHARFSDPAGALVPLVEAERLAAQSGDAVVEAEIRYARGLFLCYADRLRDGLAAMTEGIAALEALHQGISRSPEVFWERWIVAFAGTISPPTPDDHVAVERLQRAGLDSRRCVLVWFLALAGQSSAAVSEGERFLAALGRDAKTSEAARYAAAFADHGLAIAYAALGRPDAARQAGTRSRAIFRELGHHILVAFSYLTELWCGVYPFRPTDPALRRRHAAEAEAALDRAGGALAPGLSRRLAWLSCFILDGRWDEALAILRDLPMVGNVCLRREFTAPYAVIARYRGDGETAWRHISSILPKGADTPPGDVIHQEGLLLQRLAADLCLDESDLPGARAWLAAHDAWLVWSGSVLGQAEGRLAWARWHLAAGDETLARAMATEALTLAGVPDQPLVRLAAHRLLGEIATAEGRYAAAESHLASSLELATLGEIPFERALTVLALAELRMAEGDAANAAELLATGREICHPLRAVPALARADTLAARIDDQQRQASYPNGLTQREVDVLRLLAQRRTDKEIAEALFLGPRTVQSHVAHILNKLGVANRRDAAAEATRLDLL